MSNPLDALNKAKENLLGGFEAAARLTSKIDDSFFTKGGHIPTKRELDNPEQPTRLPYNRPESMEVKRTRTRSNETTNSNTTKPLDAEVVYHPFQLITKKSSSGLQGGVYYNSSLFRSLRPDDTQPISGLLNDADPKKATSGWIGISMGMKIWLGIVFDSSANITTAEISHSNSGTFDVTADAWAGTNGFCEDNGADTDAFHQTSRILIAYIVDDGKGNAKVVQAVNTHLLLRNVAIDGRAARYPFPHAGGYPV